MMSGQLPRMKIGPWLRLGLGLGLGLELGLARGIFLGGTCPRTLNLGMS